MLQMKNRRLYGLQLEILSIGFRPDAFVSTGLRGSMGRALAVFVVFFSRSSQRTWFSATVSASERLAEHTASLQGGRNDHYNPIRADEPDGHFRASVEARGNPMTTARFAGTLHEARLAVPSVSALPRKEAFG